MVHPVEFPGRQVQQAPNIFRLPLQTRQAKPGLARIQRHRGAALGAARVAQKIDRFDPVAQVEGRPRRGLAEHRVQLLGVAQKRPVMDVPQVRWQLLPQRGEIRARAQGRLQVVVELMDDVHQPLAQDAPEDVGGDALHLA